MSHIPDAALTSLEPIPVGFPVRVHDRHGDDLGVCHVPPPVELGDVLELGRGELLLLRVVDLVETSPQSPLAALDTRTTRCGRRRSGSSPWRGV